MNNVIDGTLSSPVVVVVCDMFSDLKYPLNSGIVADILPSPSIVIFVPILTPPNCVELATGTSYFNVGNTLELIFPFDSTYTISSGKSVFSCECDLSALVSNNGVITEMILASALLNIISPLCAIKKSPIELSEIVIFSAVSVKVISHLVIFYNNTKINTIKEIQNY